MNIPNSVTLDQAIGLPASELAALDVELIAGLLEELGDAQAYAKRAAEKLHEACTLKFAADAGKQREREGKDTGTVRLYRGDFTVIADLPKAVAWDEPALERIERDLIDAGEEPTEYIKVKRVVSEAAFTRWPASLQRMFNPARTVGVGRATYKIEKRSQA